MLHAHVNLVFQFQQFQLFAQENAELLQTYGRIQQLQHLLPLIQRKVQRLCHHIGQPAGVVNVHRIDIGVLGQSVAQLHNLLEHGQDHAHQGLRRRWFFTRLTDRTRADAEEGAGLLKLHNFDPPFSVNQDAGGPIRHE